MHRCTLMHMHHYATQVFISFTDNSQWWRMARREVSLFKMALTILALILLLRISVILTLLSMAVYLFLRYRKNIRTKSSLSLKPQYAWKVFSSLLDKPAESLIEVSKHFKVYLKSTNSPYIITINGFKITGSLAVAISNYSLSEGGVIEGILNTLVASGYEVAIVKRLERDKSEDAILVKYCTYSLRLTKETVRDIETKLAVALGVLLSMTNTSSTFISIKPIYGMKLLNYINMVV